MIYSSGLWVTFLRMAKLFCHSIGHRPFAMLFHAAIKPASGKSEEFGLFAQRVNDMTSRVKLH